MALVDPRMMQSTAMPQAPQLPSNGDVGFYGNQLRSLLTDPSSFKTDPGYQFALNQGLDATNRQNSKMLGSGNQLQALMNYGTGLASQAYDTRLGQLSSLSGQAQQYDLGQGQNAIANQNSANNFQLGTQQNQNTATNNANNFQLGQGQNANTAQRNANDFSLGQGQLGLGYTNAANTAQNNLFNYSLGQGQNANNAQRNANDFSLGQGQNANNFYSDQTQRGNAESNAYLGGQANNLDWTKFYYNLFPRQRVAGQP